MALVTSKSDWMAEKALLHVGLAELIPVIVGCDTCVNHKPHPEPVERALALLGVDRANALFVGDSPHDVQSGRAAGDRASDMGAPPLPGSRGGERAPRKRRKGRRNVPGAVLLSA